MAGPAAFPIWIGAGGYHRVVSLMPNVSATTDAWTTVATTFDRFEGVPLCGSVHRLHNSNRARRGGRQPARYFWYGCRSTPRPARSLHKLSEMAQVRGPTGRSFGMTRQRRVHGRHRPQSNTGRTGSLAKGGKRHEGSEMRQRSSSAEWGRMRERGGGGQAAASAMDGQETLAAAKTRRSRPR